MFLLVCILGTSFIPCYADNNVSNNKKSETSLNQDASSLSAPRRKKSKKRGRGRRGGGSDISFEQGKIEVDAGSGLPLFSILPGMTIKVPPLTLGGEYCFWSGEKCSWGVGINAAYQAVEYKEENILGNVTIPSNFKSATDTLSAGIKFNNYYVAGKIAFHYNFNSNIEFYMNLMIGYFGMKLDASANSSGMSFNYNGVLPASMLGFKFYFTDNIGMFVELGFDGGKIAGGGLSFKF
jgi:hypothetical protein